MQTSFTLTQLLDPQVASSEKILRACVHCGFCTATCPTYVLLGDELDSPRGRIYLIKEMLEQDRPATREVVKHIDRCLSCLACMTTCPSGVNYMHLVDHAREHIEKTYKRSLADRFVRGLLARVLVDPSLFRLAVVAGIVGRPFAPVLDLLGLHRMAAMLRLTPHRRPAPPVDRVGKVYPAEGTRRGRVALLSGCINPVLAPSTNEAAIRLLNRHGIEVVVAAGEACCGSLAHHMGREDEALARARNNIDAWIARARRCGSGRHSRDRFGLRHDAQGLRLHVAQRSASTPPRPRGFQRAPATSPNTWRRSICGRPARPSRSRSRITPPARCSTDKKSSESRKICSPDPVSLSRTCRKGICAAARPAPTTFFSRRWRSSCARARSPTSNVLRRMSIAAGNIGCITQLAAGTAIPVVHTVELLDWATGGPVPESLVALVSSRTAVALKSYEQIAASHHRPDCIDKTGRIACAP